MEQLELQKSDLATLLKARRLELHKLQEEVQQEEEVLQRLTSSVNKNKSELKHTYEMQKLEQNELENLRTQHAQKMGDLERIQRELLEVRLASHFGTIFACYQSFLILLFILILDLSFISFLIKRKLQL